MYIVTKVKRKHWDLRESSLYLLLTHYSLYSTTIISYNVMIKLGNNKYRSYEYIGKHNRAEFKLSDKYSWKRINSRPRWPSVGKKNKRKKSEERTGQVDTHTQRAKRCLDNGEHLSELGEASVGNEYLKETSALSTTRTRTTLLSEIRGLNEDDLFSATFF